MVSCDGLGNGGVQSVMMNIIRSLSSNYSFDMLLFTDETRYYDNEFLSYGGKIIRIPRYNRSNSIRKKMDYYIRGYALFFSVVKLLKEHGPYDIIHCNDEAESGIIIKAAAKCKIPVRIVHTHVIFQNGNPLLNIINKHRRIMIDRYSTAKIGCSKEACESFFLDKTSYQVINNPYDEEKFYCDSFLESTPFSIIQIGRISDLKNQIFSLKVINKVKETYPRILFRIVGAPEGDYYKELTSMIDKYNLSENIEFYPANSKLPTLLSKSSAMIFPSKHEGFGIVLIEAQAMGLKCYASDVVPSSTNCGGVTFIPLSAGIEKWADIIIEDYKRYNGLHKQYDVSAYTKKSVMKKICSVYEGK